MESKKTYIVRIEDNTFSFEYIQKCINEFKTIQNENLTNPEMQIIALKEITSIDFSLIGHLILFKKSMPNLNIILYFPFNKPYKSDIDSMVDTDGKSSIWKLRQYMVHAFYSTSQSIFSVVDETGEISDAEFKKDSWFVLSKKFLPIIYINGESYKSIFENSIQTISLEGLNTKKNNINEDDQYQACRKFLFKKKNATNYLQILSQLAFYKSLKDSKILRYYLNKNVFNTSYKDFQVSRVQDFSLKEIYWEKIETIFEELQSKPPIYHLVFSTLTSSDLIYSEIKNDDINSEGDKLLKLWGFSKELIYGLNELAKNIVQHSTTKQGIITGFINENNEFSINVFDYSKKGIVNTIKESTSNALDNPSLKIIFEEDLHKIESSDFKLSYLFEPNANHFLNQQTKRATAHLGLLIFSKLISENNGKLTVSSFDLERDEDIYYNNSNNKNFIPMPFGTSYQILLPTQRDRIFFYNKITSPNLQNAENTLSVEKLLSYNEKIEIRRNSDRLINIILNNNPSTDRDFEAELWHEFETCFLHNFEENFDSEQMGKSIVCIGFNNVQKRLNASQLFRFLGRWELEFSTINLIVYDISIELYFDLINVNESFLKNIKSGELPYWNTDSITLFYSFFELDKKRLFYFTDALWGYKLEDFIYINSLIKNNNYNALSNHAKYDFASISKSQTINNRMFYNGTTLLPFDLLIKDYTDTSLFEINAKTLLCNELKDKEEQQLSEYNSPIENIKSQISNLPGFKISNSHFRIGSKIHITDFYYAKRFFQNSFYASRFAFIIAKHIISEYVNKEHIKNEPISELSLIGYGLYSELLLSLVVKFMSKYCKDNNVSLKINHNLVKGYENVYKNFIVIVPIASTFSTSMKIEEKIQKLNEIDEEKKNILEPHINVLVITNGDINLKKEISSDSIEKKYGWNKIDTEKKIVTVTSYFENKNAKEQKYFVSLPSEWHIIGNCKICSPQDVNSNCIEKDCKNCEDYCIFNKCPLSEKPLLVTDKTSVTPSLIFGFPKAKDINKEGYKTHYQLSVKSLEYGHIVRNKHHFHYHIYDEIFYKDNETDIINWLKKEVALKINQKDYINYSDSDNILIIAPKHFSNTTFINVVNELLFSNSANILHYDFWNNSIENFQVFYQNEVSKANKIFFIDDTIISGSTFFKSNDFIKQTRNNNSHGFDACIVLINRIDYYTQKNINRKLCDKSSFFSFANFHLPALEDNGACCQLCLDEQKAKDLFKDSFLDRYKHAFYDRVKKMTIREVSSISKNKNIGVKPFENLNQNLMKVEAIHRIYEYFKDKENQKVFYQKENINDWLIHLLSNTISPFKKELMNCNSHNNGLSTEIAVLLKVISFPPFNIYKPIKEKIFKWTNILLNEQIERFKKKDYINFGYTDF